MSLITFFSKARFNGSKAARIRKARKHYTAKHRTDSWRNFNTCAGEIASPSGLEVRLTQPGMTVIECPGGIIDGPYGPTPEVYTAAAFELGRMER